MTFSHVVIIGLFFLMGGLGMAAVQGALSNIFESYRRTVAGRRQLANTGAVLRLNSPELAIKKLSR